MISQQSLQAFELIHRELGKRQALVLHSIFELNKQGIPSSDKQIAKHLGLPINCVVPRRFELQHKNRIYCKEINFDELGNIKVALWGIRGGYKWN